MAGWLLKAYVSPCTNKLEDLLDRNALALLRPPPTPNPQHTNPRPCSLGQAQVATAYAPDTVIDYLLLRHQPRYDFYQKFFRTIGVRACVSEAQREHCRLRPLTRHQPPQNISQELLQHSAPEAVPLTTPSGHACSAEAHTYGSVAFLSNYDSDNSSVVVYKGTEG